MTWKQHITSAEAKARRKLSIMGKLSGTNWGANEKILKSVYQGNVRPHLEYGSSSWMTAAKTHLQTLDKVQNQALRIITGAMKSTPIHSMEEITNITPLNKRRECNAMLQAAKYCCTEDHPMNNRLTQLSSGRLKGSSFVLETRALQREHHESLPKQVKPIAFSVNDYPTEDKLRNVSIQTSVPNITSKDEQSDIVKKTHTMTMLEEQYPSEFWIRVFTDGSATNAKTNGGADKVNITTPVVFLTDALSVLQSLTNNKLPLLEQALFNIQSRITVLQWIPSHCGVYGNEQADILAKQGAGQQQEKNPVCLAEMKTIIKSLYRKSKHQDSYHHLSRPEQTVIFRLRTGHNRLNKHLNRVMKVVPSPMCPCGEAEQDTTHILQTCKNHQALGQRIWPLPTTIQEKLFGTVEDLQKTTRFVEEAEIQV
ncbi:uncharacterized protein LOC125675120 [Ostrea edulis]|uniref:uncharacterized protein LOC125675120 n=1 Tax=Ostrea edulis TaxID=37623 RepID=UPI0024AEE2DC|nr:uncharacterized protein LOC125675120 [Ostrea edulis]